MIVIYARVSTEEQARSGFSLTEQLRACHSRAEALTGSPAIRAFTDQASGELLERPGLQAALELVRAGQVTCFVCLDPDRLARRLMHQLLLTDEIEGKGCRLEFVQHDYQESPEGRLFYQLRGAIAEFEKAKILERTARGQKGKIAAGGLPCLIRMYGYRFIKGAGKQAQARHVLIPDPQEAEWVRQIYRWSAHDGESPAAIAARLNSLGVPTKTGQGIWRPTQVERILRHPAYGTGRLALGKRDHRGLGIGRRLSKAQRIARGLRLSPTALPAAQWKYVEIEPLVPEDLWQQVQALPAPRAAAPASHPLSGLGRCGLCGGPLYGLSGSRLACASRYSQHWSRRPGSASGCTLPAKRRDAVEAAVWQQLKRWLLHPPYLAAAVRTGTAPNHSELRTLQTEAARREAERERIGRLYAQGLWPEAKAFAALRELEAGLTALQERIALLQQPDPDPDPALIPDPATLLTSLTEEQRAELLRLALASFELLPSPRGAAPAVKVYLRP